MTTSLDPTVWGPHYWFVLHTMAITYPPNPNAVLKKKYYDFFQNLPLFLPVPSIGNRFGELLDQYPITPYLDSQPSLLRWVHFIHNKINESLRLPEIPLEEAVLRYHALYKPKKVVEGKAKRRREKMVFAGLVFSLLIVSGMLMISNRPRR